MRTPRHTSRPGRGFGTLIGNGWLRESPRNVIPREWNAKSRSALRKCMFMQMPPHVQELAAQLPRPSPAPIPAWQPPREAPLPKPRPRDPKKDARQFAAVDPEMLRAKAQASSRGRAWWEDPVAIGTLLLLVPPVGLACVWSSKHYSNEARWALTIMSALLTCFAGGIAVALLLILR